MNEVLQTFGYWWIPENEDSANPGILHYSQENGILLELFSQDSILEISSSPKHDKQMIILGLSEEGKEITLYNCYVKRIKSQIFRGISRTEYRAHLLFIGNHFSTPSEIKFNTLAGSFSDLEKWISTTGFKTSHNFDIPNSPESIINFRRPQMKTLEINEEISLGINFSFTESYKGRCITITESPEFVVKSLVGRKSFFDLDKYINYFSNLLQMASQRNIYPLRLTGIYEYSNIHGKNESKRVNIFYQPIEPFTELKSLTPSDYLFSYDDLTDDMLRNWFYLCDEFKTELDEYQILFFQSRLFVETRFTSIVTALESLHSHLFDNTFLDPKIFKNQRDQVIEASPVKYRDWLLNDIFASVNYKRFQQKIFELLEEKDSLLTNLVKDKKRFSESTRDTRNELIHHSKQSKTFSKEELPYAVFILTYLFEAFIMEKIGFSDEKIAELYKQRTKDFLSWGRTF